ncbi:MAG: spore germination protein [Clostridium sp.]|nr:spore germination protein [Clostridium sp.]MCM1207829.1 spore germination protein [Ruminococcus sp.]
MYLDNGKISGRQAFRIGILENIAVGIIFIPYLVTGLAGKFHIIALLLGLCLFALYSIIIYYYSVCFPMGFIDTLHTSMGGFGRVLEGVYSLRYMIKAAVISVFFALIVQEYMLRSFNLWAILISFVLISGYGAARDIEKRGRLLEFLFWWMITPLILVAVLSITNVKWDVFSLPVLNKGDFTSGGIWEGSYSILIPLSSVELMMMTLHRERKRNWKSDLGILLWIMIAMVLAYIYVVGIIGAGWAGSGQGSALNVMQTASVSSNTVRRLDYPVFAFWIIGVFATVSGYIFYAKEFTGSMLRFEEEKSYQKALAIITLLVLIFIALFYVDWWRSFVVTYMIWADIAISLIVPGILLAVTKYGERKKQAAENGRETNNETGLRKGKVEILKLLVLCVAVSFTFTGCKGRDIMDGLVGGVRNADAKASRAPSIEGRAYVTELKIEGGNTLALATLTDAGYEKSYIFTFQFADLSDYQGDAGAKLKTEEHSYEGINLEDAVNTFQEKNKMTPDMGHMKKIVLSGGWQSYEDILLETADMPNVSKSTKVEAGGEEYTLMELISEVYSW